ncbi:MAG: sulfur carrier protein ThiS, partial [Nitriliruptorales bacterium]|nr:sulfur carrier protein ThiS [Nitriliruptorales bacterium]
MKVDANGREHEVAPGTTLAEFLRALEFDPRYVVVERNGEVVERGAAESVELEDGDDLVLVRAVAGGAEPSETASTHGADRVAGGAEPSETASTHGAEAFPSLSAAGERRMARLEDARLYVVT